MPETPFWPPDDEAADDAGGVALLAVAALAAPAPAPEAERASEERVQAQMRDGALSPRRLHAAAPAPAPPPLSPARRLARLLRRLLGR